MQHEEMMEEAKKIGRLLRQLDIEKSYYEKQIDSNKGYVNEVEVQIAKTLVRQDELSRML